MKSSRGQVIPLYALAVVALLGMAAMAIDVGFYRYQQRIEQTAADGAAIAGAIELIYSSASVAQFAKSDATSNGFTDDGGTTTSVTVNTPPSSGKYAGNASAVEVVILKKQPIFFGGVIGVSGPTVPVQVRAVARNNAVGAGTGCVYTLQGQLRINGGAGGFLAPNCGIIADEGMTINGNGTVTAPYIGVANGSVPSCGGCTQAHPTAALAAPDPCPVITSCNYFLTHPPSVGAAPAPTTSKGVTTYYPGEYSAKLDPGTATLSPGLYVLDAGMTAKGNTLITASGGVTIYVKGGSITMSGNSSIDLVPPSSGNYAGIALFQPATNTNDVTINGAAGSDGFAGMIYAPKSTVTLNGNIPATSELILGSLTINGSGVRVDNTGTGGQAVGIHHVVLAE